MDDLAKRAGFDQIVSAPDIFAALEYALVAARVALSSDEMESITMLKTHAIPYVNYVTGEGSKDFWRVWVDAEMKA